MGKSTKVRRDENRSMDGRHVCERKANILRAIEKLPSLKPKEDEKAQRIDAHLSA